MQGKLRENRLLCGILIIQLLILCISGMNALFGEKYVRDFSSEELNFQYDMPELVHEDENGNPYIVSDNWYPEADAWHTDQFSLKPGRYHLTVRYIARDTIAEDNRITISSEESRNYLEKETIRFSNQLTVIKKEFAVMSQADDVEITIHFGGYGTLGIQSIRIEENMIARLGNWLWKFGLFAIFDLFYVIFFGKKLTSFSEEKKWHMFLLLLTVMFASIPMFKDILNSGHDLYFHIGRIQGIADGLRSGQFPVRIYPTANNGYGYASSLFYGELLLYIPAVLYLLGVSLTRAYQFYIVAVNVGTAWISYKCFGRMFRNQRAGLLGAFLYTCAAYRIVNMTLRAAVGEFSAMMFLPLVIYAFWIMVSKESTQTEKRKAWLYLGLGISGIIQCHILTAEMVLLFIILFCIVRIRSICKADNLFTLLKAAGLTLLLNLWFLVPFIKYFRGEYNVRVGGMQMLERSALYLPQIFGVFFTHKGKNVTNSMTGEMPLMIGFALTLGVIGFVAYRVKYGERKESCYRLGFLTTVFGMLAVWMSSVYCPWYCLRIFGKTISGYLTAVQYPWRYLVIATVMFVITSLCFVILVKQKLGERVAKVCAAILIGVNVLTVGVYDTNYLNDVEENAYISREQSEFYLDQMYLPIGMDIGLFDNTVPSSSDGVVIEDYRVGKKEIDITLSNNNTTKESLILPLVYYPEYQALSISDKQKLEVTMSEDQRVMVMVPEEYSGTIQVKFKSPVLWRIAEIISILTFIVLVGCMVNAERKNIGCHWTGLRENRYED